MKAMRRAGFHRGRKLFERQMCDHAEQTGLLVEGRHDQLR
jgi:hypothetical protein